MTVASCKILLFSRIELDCKPLKHKWEIGKQTFLYTCCCYEGVSSVTSETILKILSLSKLPELHRLYFGYIRMVSSFVILVCPFIKNYNK